MKTSPAPFKVRISPTGAAVLLLATLLTIPWIGFVWGRDTLFLGDTFSYFLPFRFTLFEALQGGYLPDWESAALGGNPFCSDPQAGCYYPLSLTFLIPNFFVAYHVSLLIHLFIGAFGMWWWARIRGNATLVGLILALEAACAGPAFSLINRLDKFQSLMWWPLVLIGLERVREGSRRAVLILAGSLAMMFLAGGLEVWAMAVGAAFPYLLLVKALPQPTASDAPSPSSRPKQLLRLGLAASPALGLSLLLTAPQWLSLNELLNQSTRSTGIVFEKAAAMSLRPSELLGVAVPDLFFNEQTLAFHPFPGAPGASRYFLLLYLGWIPLLALLTGAWQVLRRPTHPSAARVSLLLAGVALLFAFGENTPVYRVVFEHVPLLRTVRYPEKFFTMASFFTLPVMAQGITTWLERPRTHFLLLGGVILVVGLYYPLGASTWLVAPLLATWQGGDVEAWAGHLQGLSPGTMRQLLLLVSFSLLIFLYARREAWRPWLEPFMALPVALDLMLGASAVNPPMPTAIWSRPPRLAASIAAHSKPPRVHLLPLYDRAPFSPPFPEPQRAYLYLREALFPNTGLLAGVSYADGSRAVRLDHTTRFFAALKGMEVGPQLEAAALAGVEYVIALSGTDLSALEGTRGPVSLEKEEEFVEVGLVRWRLTSPMPPAAGVGSLRAFPDPAAMRLAFFKGDYDPKQEVALLEADLGAHPEWRMRSPGVPFRVQSVLRDLGGKRCDVTLEPGGAAGFLVLPESFYPGWTATVDGAPATVVLANGWQQAVYLPDGVSRVSLTYSPTHRSLGLILVVLGLFGLAFSGSTFSGLARSGGLERSRSRGAPQNAALETSSEEEQRGV